MSRRKNKAPLPDTLFEAEIHGFSHDGRGITNSPEGKTCFIDGALPDEKVEYRLTKRHSRYLEGQAINILRASADRETPPCKHFGICGGCSMQHLKTESQLRLKEKTLLEQLKHFGQVSPESVLPPISQSTEGYRRKARMGVRYVEKKEKMLIGFREKANRYLAEIDTCAVLDKRVGMKLPELRALIQSLSEFQHIPQIEVSVGDEDAALIIRHMRDLPETDREKLLAFAKAENFHLYLQGNPPTPLFKLWPQDENYRLSYSLPDYDLTMQFHPLDFTQVNAEINPLMLKQALTLLDPKPEDEILDLFCGLGNFTLPIAQLAKHVIGVEGSDEMTKRAAENAALNQISNTGFFAANLAIIPEIKESWMRKTYSKILLDPPRTGAKEIIEYFPHFKAKRIVYVSCNPATLARDAGILVNQQGYRLKTVGIMNMFPHTSHIEAIALFEK